MKTGNGLRCRMLMAVAVLAAGSAMAFPTWMGVYGTTVRHADGQNPGTYMIMMNQDYVGLHAEVGVQVNGGAWQVYSMSYLNRTDNNSVWQYTPAQAYPAGATVNYYLHGFDDWGGNIWDSRNAQNYSFTVAGGGTNTLTWGTPKSVPGTSVQAMDIAAYNGMLYAVWQENGFNGSAKIMFAKKAAGAEWGAPLQILEGGYSYPRLAASESGLHLIYSDYGHVNYLRSADDGATWTGPVSFGVDTTSYGTRYAELRADANYAYVAYDDFMAPETSKIYFRRIGKAAGAWEAAKLVYTLSSYKVTVGVDDFEVRGNTLHLLTRAQSWYGGYSSCKYHSSTDGGANWTEASLNGTVQQMDEAGGTVFNAAMGTGVDGGAIVLAKRTTGAWSAQGVVWPGTAALAGLRQIDAGLVVVAQQAFLYARLSTDNGATWGQPVMVGSNANNAILKDLKDGNRMHLLVTFQTGPDTVAYQTISTEASGGAPVKWAGDTYHYPPNGSIQPSDNLWINISSWPKGAGKSAVVHYSVNGGAWKSAALEFGGVVGNNDWWHGNLGTFPANATIEYAAAVVDAYGTAFWDNNNKQNFKAKVNQGANLQAPVYWSLDPYRYDNEKVRANNKAAAASNKCFGVFPAGENVIVKCRPVENGNGNNVQGAVQMAAWLTYTTTPGNWNNAQKIYGAFTPGTAGSQPVYDFFTFNLGAFTNGTVVYFWMGATNSMGAGYAQSAGQDFWFTVGGNNADSDADGLPDSWELECFSNLTQNADGNPDGDGATGRPMANIIEWALGTPPCIPNDPAGQRLLWTPAYPVQGGTVTISYFYVNEGNPLFGKPVYAHAGKNGWLQGSVYDSARLQLNAQISRFEVTLAVPADATEINLAFHNNAGVWDNNGGKDWRIPIKAAGTGSAAKAAAADKPAGAAKELATGTRAQAAALSAGTSRGTQITVQLVSRQQLAAQRLYIGHSGWQGVRDVAMTRAVNGSQWATYTLPAGRREVNLAFRNARGRWLLNKGRGWTVVVGGNTDQKIVIEK